MTATLASSDFPLFSSDCIFYVCWLPLWYFWPLYCLSYSTDVWWLLCNVLISPYGNIWITRSVSTGYNIGILWLPIEYLLIAPLASTDYIVMSSDYHFDILWFFFVIYWLNLSCLVTITVVPLAMVLSVFFDWRLMTLWYLIIAHYDFIFDGFWLQHWYIITANLIYCDFPFGIYWLHLWCLLVSFSIYWLHLCLSLLYLWSLYFLSSLIDGWLHFCIIDNNCVIF